MQKDKLSVNNQIIHMRDTNGIKFNIVDETAAKEFLTNNTYYFKVKSYAKNYEKYISGTNNGKYINLEFAYLKELSTIDMHIRKFIIKMTLDIEHSLKTQLLRDCSENDSEDGYDLVRNFLKEYPYIMKNIDNINKNSVCGDLVLKYKGNFAIWNIVEILSFGEFISLYEMYYRKYESNESMNNCLVPVKFLRNAAAHNSCLINSLKKFRNKINVNKEINTFVSKIKGITPNIRIKKMSNPIVHDFVVTLYVFNRSVKSPLIKKYSMKELKDLVDTRFVRNKKFFVKNQLITSYYDFIKIIVDYFYVNCI